MGFLDNLLRRVVNTAVDATVENVADTVFGKKEQPTVRVSTGRADTAKENAAATKQANCSGEHLLRQRIEEAAAREKPEYELRREVSSKEVNAPEGAEPLFDYGFYQNGLLVAVIMILDGNNDYRCSSICLAQQACFEHQVKYMNFMSYMMNRPEYISQRLAQNLR